MVMPPSGSLKTSSRRRPKQNKKKTTKDHTKPVPMVRVAHKCGRVLRDEHKWQKQPSKWEIGNPNALALGFVGQYAWLTADGLQSCERNYDRREHSAGVQHQRTDSDIERQSTKSTQIDMISTPNCMIQTYAKSQPLARTIPNI